MGFPKELMEKKRWVCWRLDPDPDGGKPKKKPLNPLTGGGAMSNNPNTWTDYDAAVQAKEKCGYTGLGFMFVKEDGYVGVDIDHCYDAQTGQWNEVAQAVLSRCPTYAELSPSGDGVHLWFKGVKPEGASKNSANGIEMYDSVRYFTVTGKQLEGSPDELAASQEALDWIHENYVKKQTKKKDPRKKKKAAPVKLSDEEIIEKAKAAENGEEFTALYAGHFADKYKSQSDADISLCRMLAFWTGKDREQMERLFRASGLMRKKWDEKHHADGSTYGEETINKAIETTTNIYSPDSEPQVFEKNGRYWRRKGDSCYPLTNFVMEPVEMIVSEDETQMTADLVTVRGERFRMTFMTTDFANQQKFKNLLCKNTISLSYLGGDGDIELLKEYIDKLGWTRKTGVKAMGIYEYVGRLVFVTADGAMEHGGILVDDIVQLEKYKGIESGILRTDVLKKEALPELGHWLMGYNEPAKAVSILSWAAGCFLKEHLRMGGVKFPHLFLVGEAGSGKSTTLERVLLPLFSCTKVMASTQVTPFTLMKEAASSNVIPLPMDEFKPSKMDRVRIGTLYNHFRDAYDGHAGVRGRADQSVVTYQLLAPLIVAGEESADEAAIRERSMELLFSKKDLKDMDHRTAFNRLMSNPEMLQDFGRTLLDAALAVAPAQVVKWYHEGQGCFSKELPSRIISNLSCCYAGLKLLEQVCAGYGYAWGDVFPYRTDICTKYLEFAARDYLLDGDTSNKSIVEQTFEVMARMRLDPKTLYCIEGGRLYLWLTQVYDLYTKYRKDYAIAGEVLTYTQFKKQLQHSEYYIGSNQQKRIGSENRKCWVVDYALLSKRCDVAGFMGTEIQPLK